MPGSSTTSSKSALGLNSTVRCGVWNVRGFVQKDHCRLKESVILETNLDIMCWCETFLKSSEIISIGGYKWFGNNRTSISKRAVRGSGGVGVLVKESMFDGFSVDIVDKNHEDIIWIACTQISNPEKIVFICVCYLLPAASSKGDKSHDVFDILRSQCLKYQDKGEIMICGDFNARVGNLNDMSNDTLTNLPQRKNIDRKINSHGKQLVDFLRDCNMITLNGRSTNGKDNFTVISTVGKSVVDYTIVQAEQFHNYSEFELKTVLDVLESFSIPSDSPMPDHSLVCWEFTYNDPLLNRLPQQICGAQPNQYAMPRNTAKIRTNHSLNMIHRYIHSKS